MYDAGDINIRMILQTIKIKRKKQKTSAPVEACSTGK